MVVIALGNQEEIDDIIKTTVPADVAHRQGLFMADS